MQFAEEIEEGTGYLEEDLYNLFGIEATDPVENEVAIIVSGYLFATYDVPYEIPSLVADINYIIQEEIYR